MTSHSSAVIRRGRSQRIVAQFSPASVFESDDPTNPLHGSLVGATSDSVVVTDGKRSDFSAGAKKSHATS